jgi:very-short-patch-repair endonuclease
MERRPFRVDPQLLEFARGMRQKAAPAEQILWWCLRNRRLNGFKFRRQTPIGKYIADFYCAECKLVVELDGESHFEPAADVKDARRTERLNDDGYSVVRYTNVDVFENLDGLLATLLRECEARLPHNSADGPSPNLSPEYGGEE